MDFFVRKLSYRKILNNGSASKSIVQRFPRLSFLNKKNPILSYHQHCFTRQYIIPVQNQPIKISESLAMLWLHPFPLGVGHVLSCKVVTKDQGWMNYDHFCSSRNELSLSSLRRLSPAVMAEPISLFISRANLTEKINNSISLLLVYFTHLMTVYIASDWDWINEGLICSLICSKRG